MRIGFWTIWLWVTAAAMVPTLLFSFRNFWVVLFCVFVAVLPSAVKGARASEPLKPWVWPLAAIIAYGMVSVFWSPSDRALEDAIYHVVFGGLTILMFRARGVAPQILAIGIFVSLAALTLEAILGQPLRSALPPEQPPAKDAVAVGRGIGLAILMLPALALYAYRSNRWRAGQGAILLAGIGAATAPIAANGAMLLIGLGALLVTALRPGFGLRAVVAGVGALLAAPFAMTAALPPVSRLIEMSLPDSTLHRVVIWRAVLDKWLAGNPFFGAGVRGTEALTDELGRITLASGVEVPIVSVHPHNVPIQILYEYGLFGYALLLAAFALAARFLLSVRISRDMAATVAALIAGSSVVLMIEADIWNIYTFAAIALSAYGLKSVAERFPR